jgi:hypothetical protein
MGFLMMFLREAVSGIEGTADGTNAGVERVCAQVLLDAQQAVVLGHPV